MSSNFCIHNAILDSVDYEELLAEMQKSDLLLTKRNVKLIFDQLLEEKNQQARNRLVKNMNNILNSFHQQEG